MRGAEDLMSGPGKIPWRHHILPVALLCGFGALMVYAVPLAVSDAYHSVRNYTSEAAREDRWDRAERKRLAGEVVGGHLTFEQAGCEYRGGDWNYDANRCDPS